MTLRDAILKSRETKVKFRRSCWPNKDACILWEDGELVAYRGLDRKWVHTMWECRDLIAEDWEMMV